MYFEYQALLFQSHVITAETSHIYVSLLKFLLALQVNLLAIWKTKNIDESPEVTHDQNPITNQIDAIWRYHTENHGWRCSNAEWKKEEDSKQETESVFQRNSTNSEETAQNRTATIKGWKRVPRSAKRTDNTGGNHKKNAAVKQDTSMNVAAYSSTEKRTFQSRGQKMVELARKRVSNKINGDTKHSSLAVALNEPEQKRSGHDRPIDEPEVPKRQKLKTKLAIKAINAKLVKKISRRIGEGTFSTCYCAT